MYSSGKLQIFTSLSFPAISSTLFSRGHKFWQSAKRELAAARVKTNSGCQSGLSIAEAEFAGCDYGTARTRLAHYGDDNDQCNPLRAQYFSITCNTSIKHSSRLLKFALAAIQFRTEMMEPSESCTRYAIQRTDTNLLYNIGYSDDIADASRVSGLF